MQGGETFFRRGVVSSFDAPSQPKANLIARFGEVPAGCPMQGAFVL